MRNPIRLGISLLILLPSTFLAQRYTVIPKVDNFSPSLEDVESLEEGIQLYDTYITFHKEPKIRRDGSKQPVSGKKEDFYSNGKLLHSGEYEDGKLGTFTNFFPNESIERKYKSKGEGSGELQVFFANGFYRTVQKYYKFDLYYIENYHSNGRLSYIEIRNKKNGVPELIQESNFQGKTISKIEISDNKNLKYIQTATLPNGNIIQQGELKYDIASRKFAKDGLWETYKFGKKTSQVTYANGAMSEVVLDTRPDDEKEYLAATNSENENTSETNKVIVPKDIVRFDSNADGEITTKELDTAVNDFFEDDAITIIQINSLINFFFDQD